MTKQKKKYHLSMAGEFFVAAQLQRLGVPASVTYGNAKKADVIALSGKGNCAVVIEVKSTAQPKWVIGQYIPEEGMNPWVLVHIPAEEALNPEYYVLTQSELREICLPDTIAYNEKYKAKHGVEYGSKPGVVSVSRKKIAACKNAWHKIVEQLNA